MSEVHQGFDFAKLRYYSGWCAIVALTLAHVFAQFALENNNLASVSRTSHLHV